MPLINNIRFALFIYMKYDKDLAIMKTEPKSGYFIL